MQRITLRTCCPLRLSEFVELTRNKKPVSNGFFYVRRLGYSIIPPLQSRDHFRSPSVLLLFNMGEGRRAYGVCPSEGVVLWSVLDD